MKKRLPLVLALILAVTLITCRVTSPGNNGNAKAIRVLMVGGGSSHDFDRWYKHTDAETLRKGGFAQIRYTSVTDSIGHYLTDTDVLFLVNNQPISDRAVREAIFDFVSGGKGLVLGHAALWYNWNDWPEYNNQLVGGGSRSHDPYGIFQVTVQVPDHAIMKDIPITFSLKDELYHFKTDPGGPGITVLATGSASSDAGYPSVFVVKHRNGRIAGLALGHDGEAHALPAYQDLLRNAIAWAAASAKP